MKKSSKIDLKYIIIALAILLVGAALTHFTRHVEDNPYKDDQIEAASRMFEAEAYMKEEILSAAAKRKIFLSPARLMFAISRNVNIDMEMDGDILHKTRYSDNELTEPIKDICRQTFNKSSVEMLNIEQRYRLAKTLHRRYGLTRKQLARLTMTDPKLLKSML